MWFSLTKKKLTSSSLMVKKLEAFLLNSDKTRIFCVTSITWPCSEICGQHDETRQQAHIGKRASKLSWFSNGIIYLAREPNKKVWET